MKLTDVIRRPLITEKTSILREDGRTIVFQVHVGANKTEIKRAIETLSATEIKTKAAAAMLKQLGITGKAVLVDVAADDKLSRSLRNIPGVTLVPSARLTAREVIGAARVVATRGALEKLQEALA